MLNEEIGIFKKMCTIIAKKKGDVPNSPFQFWAVSIGIPYLFEFHAELHFNRYSVVSDAHILRKPQ
jgi:hypothetical protein